MKKHTVVRYPAAIQRASLPFGQVKAVFLSDMHNCEWDQENSSLYAAIEAEEPDLVLCGGDMPVAHPGASLEPAVRFLKKLSEKYRIFYALGNHEYRLRLYPETYGDMYARYKAALADSDILFLDNEKTQLSVKGIPVSIFGLSIERKYYRRFSRLHMPVSYLEGLIGKPEAGRVNILLAHHPKYIQTYLDWGADLTLSGHYHGGVLLLSEHRGLISPDPAFFPSHAHGRFTENGKTAVISAGLGEHTIPVRIRNPRELVVLEISTGISEKEADNNGFIC